MIKNHLMFALKVLVALVIINILAEIFTQFTNVNFQNYLFKPLASLGIRVPGGTNNAASTS